MTALEHHLPIATDRIDRPFLRSGSRPLRKADRRGPFSSFHLVLTPATAKAAAHHTRTAKPAVGETGKDAVHHKTAVCKAGTFKASIKETAIMKGAAVTEETAVTEGHAKLDTTARYTQVAANIIREVMSPLDRLTPLVPKRTDAAPT